MVTLWNRKHLRRCRWLATAGAGFDDSTGAFDRISALGGGTFSGKADPVTKFLSGNLT
jgi:hypothetical protein